MELGSEYHISLSDLSRSDENVMDYLSGFDHLAWLDSGRGALRCVTASMAPGERALLPEFICESVINCFQRDAVDFYRVNDDFTVDVEDLRRRLRPETKALFLMHYFGAVQPESTLREMRSIADDAGLVIIEDTTQSLLSARRTIGDYVVSSVRKWLPIAGGGALYFNENPMNVRATPERRSRDNGRVVGMVLKDLFLRGELDCNPLYRRLFAEAEQRLDDQSDILGMSDLSAFIVSCFNVRELKQRRTANYARLKERLSALGVKPAVSLKADDCPFVLPIRVRERNRLRGYLMDHRVYCAVHWPFDGFQADTRRGAARNAETLISLPVDQRYDESHMDYLADVIAGYGGDLRF